MTSSVVKLQSLYTQQGYLSGVPVLTAQELRKAREAFGELEREFGQEYTQYSLHNVHLQYDWVMSLVKHPKILDLVRALLGPDVIMLDSRFICKYPISHEKKSSIIEEEKHEPAEQGEPDLPFVAWHQDMRYWGLDGGPVLSVWLAFDDSLKENGALQVIPGTHCSGLLPHHLSTRGGNMLSVNQEIPEHLVQAEKAVLCPLLAGEMSVHDGLLVHGSDPNTSGNRRCGFVIRYVPTCAYPIQDPDRPRRFHATVLVSGEDRFKHFSHGAPAAV